ncbi:diguanylate cyclase domain-containing protein [uncultured Pseudokineococcus sp.]|uniref:GGDEF domain-containing protein n=1 Tax=uncultured Pseudokineococcus sp. TaxID=1642928 RepID=UPI0026229923|nr:GGDEF domain-containing protein [uncultured Pseudokineococcus sp.]
MGSSGGGGAATARGARSVPAEVARQVVLAVLGSTVAVLLTAAALRAAGGPDVPVLPQVLAWSFVMGVRVNAVQRLLGGPDLTRRTVLRQLNGCASITVALALGGFAVLVPAACSLVTAVHAQWDERPSAWTGVLASVVLTAATQAAVLTGAAPSVVPPATGALLAVAALLLAAGTSANLAVVARHRRAADAALGQERARRDAELQHALDHDALTGALGRRGLGRRLAASPRGCGAGGAAALVLDLDGFKPVNDRHGHVVGDAVLVAVVERFRRALPAEALLARTGGDEFAVVVPGVGSAAEADAIARRLEACLAAPVVVGDLVVSVGVSVGSTWTAGRPSAEQLLLEADAAMYAVKRGRHGRAPASAPAPASVPDEDPCSAPDEDPGAGVPRQHAVLDGR